MRRPLVFRSAGLVPAALALLASTACSGGTVIGSGPLPTPTPVVPHVSAEFTVPTAASAPQGITLGFDGFIYFVETSGNNIVKMTTGGVFVETAVPTANARPFGIAGMPDGSVWFTENAANQIGTLSGGTVTEYPLPTANAGPTYITRGPDGALWFSEPTANKLGRIDISGSITEFAVPTANAGLAGLAGFSDGGIWIVESNASAIVRFDVAGHTFSAPHPTLTANAAPTQIVVCPDAQTLCFTENNAAKLGQITPAGVVTEHSLAPATSAFGLVNGADFNLYFTDRAQNMIGQISGISFGVTEFAITTAGSQASFLSLGPDAEIYFTETATNKVGRLTYF
jgi:virginiamycin B lyase